VTVPVLVLDANVVPVESVTVAPTVYVPVAAGCHP
jgi:hypothetical protein